MKIVTIVWLVLAALLVILHRAAHYWLGYSETTAAFAVSDRFFGILAEFALFLVFIVPAAVSDLAKKGRLWSVIGLAGFWPVVLATYLLLNLIAPSDGKLIAMGLRDRVMGELKPVDLHQFANDVTAAKLLDNEDLINEADTSDLTKEQRLLLFDLDQKYAFMHWLNDGDEWHGPSITNYAQTGVIDFEWGGGSRGRWGCSISVDGGKNEPPSEIPGEIVRVSDDIYFYYRP
jgi:hypothetical protein